MKNAIVLLSLIGCTSDSDISRRRGMPLRRDAGQTMAPIRMKTQPVRRTLGRLRA